MKAPEYTQDTPSTDDNILGHAPSQLSNIIYEPKPRYRTCYACGEFVHYAHVEWNGHNFICRNCITLATEGAL